MAKKMNIPLLDLKKEYQLLKNDIDTQIKECLSSHHWILGEKVVEFEKKVAKYLEVKYTVGVASGTDALILGLAALALKRKKKVFFDKRDEIITTPLSFIATAEAIVRSGATPVFVDIEPDTFNIDPKEIKKAITPRTAGIMPVHLYGLPAKMDEIKRIAKRHDLFVIEDAAQGFGCEYKNKKVGSFGDCSAFSFFPSKNLGAYGDGGLISTNDKNIFELLKVLRNHGQTKVYSADYLGFNSRLDSMQAAVLLSKLKYIDKANNKRRQIAKEYSSALKNIKGISIPKEYKSARHIYHLYTVVVNKKRDQLLKYLNSCGIACRVYYPYLLPKMKVFKSAKAKGSLPVASSLTKKLLTIPLYPFLQKSEIAYIIRQIRSYFTP